MRAMSHQRQRAATAAAIATGVTLILVYVGSRGLRDFDAALIGYAVASVFVIAALTYRYTLWIGRPPTRLYFLAGWREFLSWKNFRRYTLLIPKAWWTDIFGQTFLFRRSPTRWLMHECIFWGVVISVLVTVPLTFGWIRFTLVPPDHYQAWFFGIPVLVFPISSGIGFSAFHILDFSAVLLLVGLSIATWRRITNAGLITTQRFGFDLMPLFLLAAIAVTGLALTASSNWWGGSFYWFIALTHQVVVVLWLLSLPFGKFFHIVQRPASIGVTLYQQVSQDMGPYGPQLPVRAAPSDSIAQTPAAPLTVNTARTDTPNAAPATVHRGQPALPSARHCRHCGTALPSAQFVTDLKQVLGELGQDYDLRNGLGTLQDYCPTCKRVLRARAYYELMQQRFL
ncbi:MAG TPA: hypothetical protein VFW98_18920 [Gemmatimonadaceae bacterium]|nr:hypothetical protein [Gemmatimonadaceae bacterium]